MRNISLELRPRRWLPLAALALASFGVGRAAWRRARAMRFKGKVVVVTGGSRGLGLLLAEEFGRRGAKVAFCGRDPSAVRIAERKLASLGVRAYGESVDLGSRGDAEAFLDRAAAHLGPIDVLVNNAGVIQVAPLEHQTVERIEDALRSNFWSAVHATLYVLPDLRARGAGRIVNVASIGGRVPVPHMAGYTASKFAMLGFSEALRTELAGTGVKVTTVVPGPMRTGSFMNAQFAGQAEREFRWFSLLSSLPIATLSARTAARRIVRACAAGAPELELGAGAHIIELFRGFAPGWLHLAMRLFGAILPGPSTDSGPPLRGRELARDGAIGALSALGRRAARENNELASQS